MVCPRLEAQRLTAGIAFTAAQHRVDAGFGREVTSGLLGTFDLSAAVGRFALGVEATGGTMTGADLPDRRLGEIRGSVAFMVRPWLALEAAAATRTYTVPVARQRWTAGSIGSEVKVAFAGGHIEGVGRLMFTPLVSVTDLDARPSLSAAAGIDYRRGPATVRLAYWLERSSFVAQGGVSRREQLSGLTLRFRVSRQVG